MVIPARDTPGAAAQELTPEAVLMRQFLIWALGAVVAMGLMVLVLWVLFSTLTALVMLGVITLGFLPGFGYAYRLAGQNRVDRALLLVSSMIWTTSLVPAAVRGGDVMAVAALMALLPVVLAVAYSSRRTLLQIILISVVVCAAASVLGTYDDLLPTRLTEVAARRVEGGVATSIMALISFSLWHSASRLRRMLAQTRAANRALKESERDLERKVEVRTAELSVARTEAEEANKTKSQFLASMSHELRTPLNAIIGYSEMLQDEARDDGQDAYLADLDRILNSSRHLLELINGVLDLAKIESGKMDLYLEDFDVAGLVRGVEGTLQPLVRKTANQLEVSGLDALGSMHSDVTKLRQILFNLLSNASKFTKEGSIRLEVDRATQAGEDWLCFRVSDSGVGMTEEQLARVFDEFSQADASTTKEYGGTGLGLPISKKFCELLGGSITATSEAGVGSCFEVRLPARAPTPIAEETPEQRPVAEKTPGVADSEATTTVLVIDDDPAARDLIGRFLAGEGFGVLTATSGEEGLRLAREQRPGLIILDVVMPQMDGWSVLQQLKAEPGLAAIPVILVTITDDRNLGYALGAAEYLTKPVDWDHLGAVLRRYADEDEASLALVVDDEADARDMLRRGMERAGWRVAEAENGRVALERVAEALPRLILLDLMMPEMDGFEFVSELRRNEAWRSIPVLVITALEITAEDRARLEGNVARILQKGEYGRDELLREVRRLSS